MSRVYTIGMFSLPVTERHGPIKMFCTELCGLVYTSRRHKPIQNSIGFCPNFIGICVGLGIEKCAEKITQVTSQFFMESSAHVTGVAAKSQSILLRSQVKNMNCYPKLSIAAMWIVIVRKQHHSFETKLLCAVN